MPHAMTLTEFNQNPSHATRLADDGDGVLILRRGSAAYRLTAIAPVSDAIEALIASDLATSPRSQTRRTNFRRISSDLDVGALLDEDRGRLDH